MQMKFTATRVLIGLNVISYLLWQSLRPEFSGAGPFALYLPGHPDFRPWQFVTSIFMHADTGHLLMNMLGLFMFGEVLERMWGARRFLIFFLATGLGAGLVYSAVTAWEVDTGVDQLVERGLDREAVERGLEMENPRTALMTMVGVTRNVTESLVDDMAEVYRNYHVPVVGASGALYGILTAFGLLYPNAKLALIFLPVPVAAKYFIPGLLLLDLFSGVTGFSIFGGGIAHFAHLGGALIGFLLMRHWRDLAAPMSTIHFGAR